MIYKIFIFVEVFIFINCKFYYHEMVELFQ